MLDKKFILILILNIVFVFLNIEHALSIDPRIETLTNIQDIYKKRDYYKKWTEVWELSANFMKDRYWKNVNSFKRLHKIWGATFHKLANIKARDIVFLYFMNAKWDKVIEISDNRAWVTVTNPTAAIKGAYLIKEDRRWKRCGLSTMIEIAYKDLTLLNQAIKDYHKHKKKLPLALEELKPNYIDNLSSDPFNTKNMTYNYKVNGMNWKLYSVGIDGKDDLGEIEYNYKVIPIDQDFSRGDIILEDGV